VPFSKKMNLDTKKKKTIDRLHRFKKGTAVLCLSLTMTGMLTGCEKLPFGEESNTKVVLTSGFGGEEIFRISRSSCTKPELMVYLTNMQNQYETVYGPDIWNAGAQGVTLEQRLKDSVIARIAQVKTMALLAQDHEVTLSENENGKIEKAAEAYYSSLSPEEIEQMGITKDTILGLYKEFALANAVYDKIIQDVNPEISDDEARTITVEQIVLHNYKTDALGNKIPDSEEEQKEDLKIARRVIRHINKGEDFALLAEKYSDEEEVTVSFGKGEVDRSLEDAAFDLDNGEVSSVVKAEDGYYVIRCISTFDVKQTDANKEKLMKKRKKEVFNEVYNRFVNSLTRSLNEELWNGISMIHDKNVTTADFFSVYEEYCGKTQEL